MLDLVLEKKAGLRGADLKNCRAKIELAPASSDPVLEAVTAEGVFSLVNSGNAVDAAITARGVIGREAAVEPKDIKVKLTADATIKVSFAEGETEVDTGIIWEDGAGGAGKSPSVKPDSITATAEQDDAKHPFTLRLTRTGGSKAAKLEVTLLGVEVATGCGRDNNCNGPVTIKAVGEAHVDALCNWERASDLKANPTHFRISTVSPHEKIYSIDAVKKPGVGG